jgi:hypothetical protein
MNLAKFHVKLFGHDPSETPEAYLITVSQLALYTGHTDLGFRGFSNNERDEELFLATFVLALNQTQGTERTVLVVAQPHVRWAIKQVETIARYAFRRRQGDPKEEVRVLRDAFYQLNLTSKVLRIDEPERWVIFGFNEADPLPIWAKDKLLTIGN